MPEPATIGVDLGGTHVRVAVVDRDGTIVDERRGDAPHGGDAVLEAVVTLVAGIRADHPDTGAVGVGVAALVDFDGTARYAPNIAGLRNTPIQQALAARLDVPVVVDNDANVAAWGEVMHGAAHGAGNALLITLGTGIGGGIILDGQVLRGAAGFAGEVGHFQIDPDGPQCACGERGHWEAYASGTALGRQGRDAARSGSAPNVLARAGGDVESVTGVHVGDAARDGALDALGILRTYGDYVAIGLAGLANILDPEVIVISGGLVDLGEVLLDPMRESFGRRIEGQDYRPEIPVVPAALGSDAGVVGAAARARGLVA